MRLQSMASYKSKYLRKRKVLSSDLNVVREVFVFKFSGSVFHNLGAMFSNARSPYDTVLGGGDGCSKRHLFEDRSLRAGR